MTASGSGSVEKRPVPLLAHAVEQHRRVGLEPDGDAALRGSARASPRSCRRRRRSRAPPARCRAAAPRRASRPRENPPRHSLAKISAMLRLAAFSISASASRKGRCRRLASRRPIEVLPAPIMPTSTMQRLPRRASTRSICSPSVTAWRASMTASSARGGAPPLLGGVKVRPHRLAIARARTG